MICICFLFLFLERRQSLKSLSTSHDHEINDHSKSAHGSNELNPPQNATKHYKGSIANSYRTSSDASLSINNPHHDILTNHQHLQEGNEEEEESVISQSSDHIPPSRHANKLLSGITKQTHNIKHILLSLHKYYTFVSVLLSFHNLSVFKSDKIEI